ncbi:MAG: aminotransferase class I/II-fold pyridoxal phosphate-dependent enzyme [Hyphomicrobium sp.]
MANGKDSGLIGGTMKDAVLSLMSRPAGEVRSRLSLRAKAEPQWTAREFTSLDTYQSVQKQRAAVEVLGLKDPFFRQHDERAGATSRIAGRQVINFGSYDYIGLNHDPRVSAAAKSAIDTFGISASASRPTAGERGVHRALEQRLAGIYGVEDAVVFVSGHATNVSSIATLVGERDLVIMDALVHNSATVGAQLSGAARRSFAHNDLDSLERQLAETRGQFENVLIVVEGLYSMDGDMPDLPRLVAIKKRYGAWLMVDEAHALGVLGARGHGIAEEQGVDSREIDIWMGTLSKSCAACGGYIAGSAALVEIMKCHAPSFVYSVAMPPAVAAGALAALDILVAEPDRVRRLRENGHYFLNAARSLGLDTGPAQGFAVVPIMVGDSLKAVKLVERLLERGVNVVPIIYPAVPMQSARLRFFITSEHTAEQLDFAAQVTREEIDRLSSEKFGLSAVVSGMIGDRERTT